ncbi:hypothetical protein K1719_014201 [Acacia pycnantha]|nr:hypothetical protein K1719_014201 [Acacia pycnantha]
MFSKDYTSCLMSPLIIVIFAKNASEIKSTVMHESGELQSEENKVSIEKNKKRRLKTPAQLMALEKFYDEHKYPTEEMKSDLAEELGLTEKQVSGWFCHRRSVKWRRPGPYMTYEHNRDYNEDVDGMDNTSSESSSSLQDQLFSQGYLKVKGEIENATITAVKKQLGRNYREDGPLLGVEFDPVPPGAFECQIAADPVDESLQFHTVDPSLPSPPEISAVKRQPALNSRYDSKYGSHDLDMEVGDLGSLHDTDLLNRKPRRHKQGRTFQSYPKHLPHRNSPLELYEDAAGAVPAYNTMGSKHGEGMRSDSASYQSDHFEEDLVVKQTDSLLHCYDNVNPKKIQRSEDIKSKPSKSLKNSRISLDTEERGLSSRIAKEEKFGGGKKARKQYHDSERRRILPNETMIAKRVKDDLPQQQNLKHSLVAEMQPQKNRRSATEMLSSFSEDETAETSYSLD